MKHLLLAAGLLGACGVAAALEPPAAATTAPTADPFTGGNAEAGATRAATCAACHGPGGNSAVPEWPKLAGQSPAYIVQQLKNFKSGARKNPVMTPQAAPLSEDDMKNLAAYFAQQKPSPGVGSPDAVKVAEKLYRAGDKARDLPACAACHGPKGAGNLAAGYPRIGGQHAKYAAGALRQLRNEVNAPLPPMSAAMASIAAKLTENEIEALASYVNGLQ